MAPTEINDNVFDLIDKQWLLITAGNMVKHNTMTASWAGLGILWRKNVVFCFIRPQRHTYKFMEENNFFTISFYEEKFRKALNICGSSSGRDYDKVKAAGLTPIETENNSVVFEESRMFFECKKIYYDDLKSSQFLVPEIEKNYRLQDYHRLYIGEIIKSYKKI